MRLKTKRNALLIAFTLSLMMFPLAFQSIDTMMVEINKAPRMIGISPTGYEVNMIDPQTGDVVKSSGFILAGIEDMREAVYYLVWRGQFIDEGAHDITVREINYGFWQYQFEVRWFWMDFEPEDFPDDADAYYAYCAKFTKIERVKWQIDRDPNKNICQVGPSSGWGEMYVEVDFDDIFNYYGGGDYVLSTEISYEDTQKVWDWSQTDFFCQYPMILAWYD